MTYVSRAVYRKLFAYTLPFQLADQAQALQETHSKVAEAALAQQQVEERKRATAAAIAKTAEAQREGERLTREGQAVARRLQEADGRAAQMEAQLQSVR